MKTIHIIVCGVVQGIGYRQWLKRGAKRYPITGWVRNIEDGSVEAIVCGEEKNVDSFMHLVKRGPPLANITDIKIEPYTTKETFSLFSVLQ